MKVTIILMAMNLPDSPQQKQLNPFTRRCKQWTHHDSSTLIVRDCFLFCLSPSPPLRVLIPDVQDLVVQSMAGERRSQRQVPEDYVYTEYHPMEEVKRSPALLACSVTAVLWMPQQTTPCLQKAQMKPVGLFLIFFFAGLFLTVRLESWPGWTKHEFAIDFD